MKGIIFVLIVKLALSFYEKDPNIKLKDPFYKDPNFFPKEIEEKYGFYVPLNELENTCDLVHQFENFPKNCFATIKDKQCILNSQSFTYLLEEGLLEEAKYVIRELYLPNEVDPTYELRNWLSKKEARIKYVSSIINPPLHNKQITGKYSFLNYDNFVKFVLKLDDNYLTDKLTVLCHKNMLIIRGNFFKSTKQFYLNERKKTYDEIDSCDFNYNQFKSELEVTIKKVNKLKKWESLFIN